MNQNLIKQRLFRQLCNECKKVVGCLVDNDDSCSECSNDFFMGVC